LGNGAVACQGENCLRGLKQRFEITQVAEEVALGLGTSKAGSSMINGPLEQLLSNLCYLPPASADQNEVFLPYLH